MCAEFKVCVSTEEKRYPGSCTGCGCVNAEKISKFTLDHHHHRENLYDRHLWLDDKEKLIRLGRNILFLLK